MNEKISARKLFEDMPNAPMLADKIAVREYVAETVGDKYLNEAYRVALNPAEIDFEGLPEAFVAKPNHGSRMNVFVRQKSITDLQSVREQLSAFLARKHGRLTNEWWYEGITPQVLVERFVDISVDYRFWVFHGVAEFVKAADLHGRGITCFDRDWQPQAFGGRAPGFEIPRPAKLGEMLEVAGALAADLPFARVDLFSPHDREVLFCEVTLAPSSGWSRRSAVEEATFGALW